MGKAKQTKLRKPTLTLVERCLDARAPVVIGSKSRQTAEGFLYLILNCEGRLTPDPLLRSVALTSMCSIRPWVNGFNLVDKMYFFIYIGQDRMLY